MKNCLQHNQILLVLVITVWSTQAIFVQNIYTKMEPGQRITGKAKAQFTTESAQECSFRFAKLLRYAQS